MLIFPKKSLLVLFGPPGAGKTTQAKWLQEKCGLTYVSWGAISRQIADGHGPHRQHASLVRGVHRNQETFPAGFVANLLEEELARIMDDPNAKGVVLDGFPRRISEAKELETIIKKHKLHLRAAIRLNINHETLLERVRDRRYCPVCGTMYSSASRPDREGLCDHDGHRLIRRKDDELDAARGRMEAYMEESLEAFSYIASRADFSFDVNANQDEVSIFSELIGKLNAEAHINHRLHHRIGQTPLQTRFGTFTLIGYQNIINYETHLVLQKGDVSGRRSVPVRVHSSCMTGDIFGSMRCDCGEQLHRSLTAIQNLDCGLVIYLLQEGRGINILNKIKAYELQSRGMDTVEANESLGLPSELRDYTVVRDILCDLDIRSIQLMTNNPDKVSKLQGLGIMIENRLPLESNPNEHNRHYLWTKAERMGHILPHLISHPEYATSRN